MTRHEIIDLYLKGSAEIATLLDQLQIEIDDYNMSLSDLDHYLELEEALTVEQLKALQDTRREVLLERRKAKDMVRVIDQILPKQIEGRTTQDRYEYAVRNLEGRVYTPRKITLEEAITTH